MKAIKVTILYILNTLKVYLNVKLFFCSLCEMNSSTKTSFTQHLHTYLSHSKAALSAGHNLVPFVMQHVHEPVGFVLTNKL